MPQDSQSKSPSKRLFQWLKSWSSTASGSARRTTMAHHHQSRNDSLASSQRRLQNSATKKPSSDSLASTNTSHSANSETHDASSHHRRSREHQHQQQRRAKQHQRRQQQQQLQHRLSPDQAALIAYVPEYLKPFIFPYHGDYCYTPIFQPQFIAQVMAEGFLPVATKGMLLPKLHRQRSVISLPDGLHISKSVRKKSKRFALSVNQQFDAVIEGCHEQHGKNCWLYPPLVEAFRQIFQAIAVDASPDQQYHSVNHSIVPQGEFQAAATSSEANKRRLVRLYTIEVWNAETGALAGGEIGYTVGSIYTSLTGFTVEASAGSVQLAALGRLLSEKGFDMWDLGMDMEYKRGIGSKLMPRATYVSEVHRVRDTHHHLVLPAGEPARNCKEIIDRNQPQPQPNNPQPQVAMKKMPKSNKDLKDATHSSAMQSHTPPPMETDPHAQKKVRK